jgi:hypothetical protein
MRLLTEFIYHAKAERIFHIAPKACVTNSIGLEFCLRSTALTAADGTGRWTRASSAVAD